MERKENKLWGPGVFSLSPPKIFSQKWIENWVGVNFFLIDKNAHMHVYMSFFKFVGSGFEYYSYKMIEFKPNEPNTMNL